MIEVAPIEHHAHADFATAELYIWQLSIDGKRGWRLPTTEEINSVICIDPAIIAKVESYEKRVRPLDSADHAWCHGDGDPALDLTLSQNCWVIPVRDL